MTRCLFRPTMTAAAFAAAALTLSCGGGSPSSSTPTTVPTPTPTATPTSPSGGNGSQACPLGKGDVNAQCSSADKKTVAELADQVMAAMDRLVSKKPQLFNLGDANPPGSVNYRVVDKDGYLNGLVAELQLAGLCAQRNPDDYLYQQIQVKDANAFSENYDVLTSKGYVWHSASALLATCVPASFPIDRGDLPPAGSGCGAPYPPPIKKFNSKIWMPAPAFDTLDSTPIVQDAAYCALIGFTDGRATCPVRASDSPERTACETWRVGYAKDSGRPGPTWTFNGKYCTGPASGCELDPDNQYKLRVYVQGTFVMCGNINGACGSQLDNNTHTAPSPTP